ncbi:peptidase M28 [Mycobacterium sp. IS-1742]|uniref:M20/M25/M40 family metallo-hydrolase n=1 Tax=Mycobacterium sp. IS-1742 TaxID=1772285 RepID=UPI00073FD99D|nr:M20/M25/M40 family metallo-hydrolase [Mycobacterium sp. IS-1742]KUI27388.1 peptidase M28 [Mycobacterium sp. IS-1742]
MRIGWVVTAAAAALAMACSSPAPPPVVSPEELAGEITVDALYTHLEALQDIAERHGGNRAQGTAGFDASVDYVADMLRDKGFEVQTPEFDRYGGTRGGAPKLTVNGRGHPVEKASLLVDTGPGGLDALTLRPSKPAGCSAGDYGRVDVRRAIAVVDDTGCSVVVKQNVAVAKGAVGVLVATGRAGGGSPPGLFTPGYYRELTIPVGIINADTDAALRRTSAPVRLRLDGQPVMAKSRNVLAQTKTGDTRNVVIAGAHLDSVASGPGINDNATGVAAVLETALQLGSSPQVVNAVRFAFWGSEEIGLEGSRAYLRGLDEEQLDDIALYLNVDMVGSPNAGYFTYDGDQSAATTPVPVPEGSAGIERLLAGYLNQVGVRPADMALSGQTDYHPFMAAGVPFGGTTTGAAQQKTPVQARLWGGRADVAFDPNYHTPRDTIHNVDRRALGLMAPAVAFAVGTYAQSTDGVNGVPPRDRRARKTR